MGYTEADAEMDAEDMRDIDWEAEEEEQQENRVSELFPRWPAQ